MKKSIKHLVLLGLSATTLIVGLAPTVLAQEENSESEVSSEMTSESASSEEFAEDTTQTDEETEASPAQQALESAVEIFREEFPDAEIDQINVELRNDSFYEVELDGFSEDTDYELTVHSENNEIRDREEESSDDNDHEVALDLENLLSLDEATEIALSEVSLPTPTQWDLDSDRDRFVWEVEFDEDENEGQEATVEIDAESGDVLDVDLDD